MRLDLAGLLRHPDITYGLIDESAVEQVGFAFWHHHDEPHITYWNVEDVHETKNEAAGNPKGSYVFTTAQLEFIGEVLHLTPTTLENPL